MKHPTHQPSHILRPFLIALCLALGTLLALAAPTGAASSRVRLPLALPDKPGVAIAEVATVRVETTYTLNFLTISTTSTPFYKPFTQTGNCSGLGVLVASTDHQGAGSTYLLTTTQVYAPTTFCQTSPLTGATLSSASLTQVQVYLSTAYAGESAAGTPSATFTLTRSDKGWPESLASAPLVLLPLTAPAGAPAHDYPTVPLTPPAGSGSGQAVALDLADKSAKPLTTVQLNGLALPETPLPTPQAHATQFLTPLSQPSNGTTLSPGAPLFDDQTGVLVGLAGQAGSFAVVTVAGLVSGLPKPLCPGDGQCLGQRWQDAMKLFYGSSTHSGSAKLLQGIKQSYPDFVGVQEFVTAASPAQGSTPTANNGPGGTSGTSSTAIYIALGVLGALLVAVIILASALWVRRARRRHRQDEEARREIAEQRQAPFAPRTASGHLAAASFSAPAVGGLPPVSPGAQTLPYTPTMQNMAQQATRLVTCPTCGVPNNAGSSVCINCGHDLPQSQGAMSGGRAVSFPPGISGGPAPRINLPALSQPPAPMPLVPAAPDFAAQMSPPYEDRIRAPRSGDGQDTTEPNLQALVQPGAEERTIALPGRKRSAFGVLVSSKSDKGRKRAGKENEDNFLTITGSRVHNGQVEPFGLFVVADGMGGHANGQDASRMAIESIYLDLAPQLTQQEVPDDRLTALLQQAVQNANQKLYRQNQLDHADMGCTMTAALVAGNEAHICNVGDSRTYLLRQGGELQRVTIDHSIVQSLVDAGVITKDDVYTHPKRNQIYRSLGEKEVIEVDGFTQRVSPGDKLLLCCDGLWEMIHDNEIEMILSQNEDLPQASTKLIEMANEHGGVDNITAIVVKVMAPPQPGAGPDRPSIESVDSGPSKLPKRVVG
jgi:serine/threonine protein phosphatase PrpC